MDGKQMMARMKSGADPMDLLAEVVTDKIGRSIAEHVIQGYQSCALLVNGRITKEDLDGVSKESLREVARLSKEWHQEQIDAVMDFVIKSAESVVARQKVELRRRAKR